MKILENKGKIYRYWVLGVDYAPEDLVKLVPRAKSVPQIFQDEKYVGGLKELKDHLE